MIRSLAARAAARKLQRDGDGFAGRAVERLDRARLTERLVAPQPGRAALGGGGADLVELAGVRVHELGREPLGVLADQDDLGAGRCLPPGRDEDRALRADDLDAVAAMDVHPAVEGAQDVALETQR